MYLVKEKDDPRSVGGAYMKVLSNGCLQTLPVPLLLALKGAIELYSESMQKTN
jgi:hypothetical protein